MKPTVPEVEPLVRELYQRSPVGCCLHIVLDDENVDYGNVQFCRDYAVSRGHKLCVEVADKLLLMSRTQRLKLARLSGL